MKGIALLTLLFVLVSGSLFAQADSPLFASNARYTSEEIISVGWYPNPVHLGEKICVEVNLALETEMKTELVNALGQKVFELFASYPEGKSRMYIYTDDLEAGLYFVRITTEHKGITEKIIIE